MRARTRAAGAAVGLMALVLAGCSDGSGDGASDDASDGASDDAGGMSDATVAVAGTDLGDVLVGADGMTLYMFDPDEQGEATCYDDCATAWPPLTVEGEPVAGEGVDEGKLGTTERTDGTTQVTYDGWPLYYWAQDAEPGDTTGQGVNDVWWVLDADGEPIRD